MKNKNKGQSLIEVLVAITIASLVAIALVRATGTSIKNSTYSRDQSAATDLAQKKINTVIDDKNQNPTSFFTTLPSYLDDVTTAGFCLKTTLSSVSILPTPPDANAKMAKIVETVFWEDTGGGSDCNARSYRYKTSFETNVTN